jgi:TIR domain-containing protein/NACHT domain-containing protein
MRKEQIVAPLTLFYSYTREDQALLDRLEKHLRQLQRQELISAWHEREILLGGTWADEIDVHLQTASIILLLVSPDFLASDYCYDAQMQRALERHRSGAARVIPIILRPCDWQHSPLKDLQCLPRDGKPVTRWQDQDEVFHVITQDLRRVIEQQQALVRPPVPLSPLDRQNRMRLLKQVRAIWIDGLLTQSLHRAAGIELCLQDRPDVLANPWRFQVQELDQDPQALPAGTSIVQVYDRAGGELLVLGEPGAGKTTLLLELARTLLERAEQDERLRMPIVFHLSSWAEKRQALRTWLVEELRTKYQVPRKIGQSWIDADQVLPLLDGLDEVARDARTACVEQINDYYQARLERGSSPVVICCRSEEYTALSTRVMLQHAVSVLPLTDEQINTYLEQAGEQVQALRQALHEDAELHSLARQPLMLNIFTFAYQRATAAEIPVGETREEMQHSVFARYVEHMLKRRGQSKRWEPEQVVRWLTFLAGQMRQDGQTVFAVENLQPIWLSEKWRILYQWCVRLVIGLLVGLLWGGSVWPYGGLLVGLFVGLVGLLAGGPSFVVVSEMISELSSGWGGGLLSSEIHLTEAVTWSWKKARSQLVNVLGLALALGLIAGLLAWLESLGIEVPSPLSIKLPGEPGFWVVIGLCEGLIVGLFVGLIFVLVYGLSRRQLPERLSLSPNGGIWRSGKNGFLVGLGFWQVVGLPIGLGFKLIGGQYLGLTNALSDWLCLGLSSGLVIGLSFGLNAFVQHFILRFFLARRGDLPWDLVPFLDEAAERLLLRKVGGSYIFAHRLLLEYFADLAEENE